jgi:hypothetical protein
LLESLFVEAGKRKLLALAFAAVLVVPVIVSQQAHADGLFQENIQGNIQGRDVNMFIRINPPILTTETQQDAFVQIRLFEGNNQTIRFSTFIISILKVEGDDEEQLLSPDAFHTESGLLTLKIQPQEGPVDVFATREDFLNAWKADPGGTVNIRGPILLEGGLYHFRIDVIGVDSIRGLLPPDQVRTFDTYLSVGDVTTHDVQYEGQSYPTRVISYYDQVQDFSFDPETLTYTWSMPFNWNISRIEAAPNFFVHQEVQVPKSFAGVGDGMTFTGSVNGVPVAQRMLQLDPFTSETELTLHFLINKNDVLALAQQVPEGTEGMTFSFSPGSGEQQTSGEIATDTGGVHVLLHWNPGQLGAGTQSTLDLGFLDAFSGETITDDVTYDIRIFDDGGAEVFAEADQVAQGGKAQHALTFPEDKTYRVEVTVKAVQEPGQSPDLTRNGIARGIVIVPEFPAGAILAVAGALGAIVIAQRFVRRSR